MTLPLSYSRLRASLSQCRWRRGEADPHRSSFHLSRPARQPGPASSYESPSPDSSGGRRLVARGGFEPPKPLGRQIYSLLRLTAPQPRRLQAVRAPQKRLDRLTPGDRPPTTKRCSEFELEQLVYRLDGNDLCARRFAVSGAGEGIRTPDLLITNQLLYRTELRQPDKFIILAHAIPLSKRSASSRDTMWSMPVTL